MTAMAACRKISLANGSGSRDTSFTYTTGGDFASITNPEGNTTALEYGAGHKVTSVKQGKGSDLATTRFSYASSTQTLVADPDTDTGQAVASVDHTTYTINASQRVTKTVDPLGHTRDKTYASYSAVSQPDQRDRRDRQRQLVRQQWSIGGRVDLGVRVQAGVQLRRVRHQPIQPRKTAPMARATSR